MEVNHYDVLGVSPTSSVTEIRSAFKRLARKYHPDKRQSELTKLGNPQMYDDNVASLVGTGSNTWDEMFSSLANAYNILSDDVKRAAYDIHLMGKQKSGKLGILESMKRLRSLKRKEAELQSKLMEVTYEQRREFEVKKGGLVILNAWFGALQALDHPSKHPNEIVDVTRQLQTIVDNSRVVLPAEESKAITIPGVFDPCPETSEKGLRVRYTFKGKLHIGTVRDDERFLAPVKTHLVESGKKTSSFVDQTELEILCGPGSGQIVQSKSVPMKQIKKKSSIFFVHHWLSIIGILSVVGSVVVTKHRNKFSI